MFVPNVIVYQMNTDYTDMCVETLVFSYKENSDYCKIKIFEKHGFSSI